MAKTHSPGKPLTFEELCEEALGSGLHPWEFYEYGLPEYMQRRKGRQREQKLRYQELLLSAMAPYMKKEDRKKVVSDAFRDPDKRELSLKEQYAKLKQKHIDAGVLIE